MVKDALKLTTYSGERDTFDGRLLADALIDTYERHAVSASVLFRGIEGFGMKRRLQTQRLLTLSEDLPIVTVAVDARERIEPLLDRVREINGHGVVTLERALLVRGSIAPGELPADASAIKLTIYVGRQERADGRPAHLAVVDLLHRHGVAGATVLLGVDGTAHGVRERGRFFARNAQVPLMIVSVGESERIAGVLPGLSAMLNEPLLAIERVRICKRDGTRLAGAGEPAPVEASGEAHMQRLTLYVGEQARHAGQPLYSALIARLRREGASGATALRGLWGYHGDHPPHGERFWSVRRHVPVIMMLLDTPANAERWFEIVDEMTEQTGLLTSEIVPVLWGPAARPAP
jgi:PII-like signaling protein